MTISLTKPTVGSTGWGSQVNQNFTDLEAAVNAGVVPTGAILPFAGSSAPTGYLLCDGSSVSRTTYSALFGVVSTTYGSADGSSFNLPDLRARVPVAANHSGLPNGANGSLSTRSVAGTGGAESVTLSTSELPSHSHNVTDNGHYHNDPVSLTTGLTNVPAALSSRSPTTAGTAGTSTAYTGISIQSTGGGGAHENMPPFVVLNYVIKT